LIRKERAECNEIISRKQNKKEGHAYTLLLFIIL